MAKFKVLATAFTAVVLVFGVAFAQQFGPYTSPTIGPKLFDLLTAESEIRVAPKPQASAAFPGACGHGAGPRDWSTAQVFIVDKLTDTLPNGVPGELRYGIMQTGPRIIVFKTGGTITLAENFTLRSADSDLYIAGQTAPGDGITIIGRHEDNVFYLRDIQNFIMRYVSIRGTKGAPGTGDIVAVVGAQNVVLDHISASWSNDEIFGFNNQDQDNVPHRGVQNRVAATNNLLAEPLAPHSTVWLIGSYFDSAETAYGIYGTNTAPPFDTTITNDGARQGFKAQHLHERVTAHRNVIAHGTHRLPTVTSRGTIVSNNVIYGWSIFGPLVQGAAEADFLSNMLIENVPGPTEPEYMVFSKQSYLHLSGYSGSHPATNIDDANLMFFPLASVYFNGNYIDYSANDTNDGIMADEWDPAHWGERIGDGTLPYACDGSDYRCLDNNKRDTPMTVEGYAQCPIDTASAALIDDILDDAGNSKGVDCAGKWFTRRDSIDTRQIDLIRTKGNSVAPRSVSGSASSVNTSPSDPTEVGGYATIAAGTACADSDNDGMPDEYELWAGLEVAVNDATADKNGNGYTNIEEYFNGRQ